MPLFVLSPASLAHSALFAGYYSYLSTNVTSLRLKSGLLLGNGETGSVGAKDRKASPSDASNEEALNRSVRAHSNFTESGPFTFFLIFLAELNGAPTYLVHAAYSTLFLARVAQAETGIRAADTVAIVQPIGTLISVGVTLAAGAYNLSLGWEPLKSFIGLK